MISETRRQVAPQPPLTPGLVGPPPLPAGSRVKFVESQQTLPVVADSYGRKRIAALEDDSGTQEPQDCSDLLDGVDLATLDQATVAALYEELQEAESEEEETDFHDGQ